MLSRRTVLLLLFGAFVVTPCLLGPVVRAAEQEDEEDEYLDVEDDSAPAEPVDDGNVVTLTSDNFDSIIKENKNVLVEFYAPWCGHCKSLAPEYAKASVSLKEQAPEVVIAKVDATVETTLAEKYGVSGFPTIYWFHDGKETEFDGGRDESSIVRWVMKKVGPAAQTVKSVEELHTAEGDKDVVVVGYFKDLSATTAPALAAFTETCRELDFECLQTDDAAVASDAGAALDSIAVVNKFLPDKKRVTVPYKGAMEAEALTKFVKGQSLPTVVPFVGDYPDRIFAVGIQRHLILVGEADDISPAKDAMKAFTKVAEKYKDKGEFTFITADVNHDDAEPVVNFFELEDADYPMLIGFQLEPSQKKFTFQDSLTEAAIEKFAAGILDGSIQPSLKSEEVPEDDMDGNVKVVVGKSFDDIVTDKSKDVLLEVYAPWCGHCKNLEPIYKKLATRFKDIDSVVIAKMDGTANEVADLEVEGFPYIAFYPAKEGAEPVKYEGERTLKAMTKFIKEHAVVPYELKKKASAEDSSDSKDEL